MITRQSLLANTSRYASEGSEGMCMSIYVMGFFLNDITGNSILAMVVSHK